MKPGRHVQLLAAKADRAGQGNQEKLLAAGQDHPITQPLHAPFSPPNLFRYKTLWNSQSEDEQIVDSTVEQLHSDSQFQPRNQD